MKTQRIRSWAILIALAGLVFALMLIFSAKGAGARLGCTGLQRLTAEQRAVLCTYSFAAHTELWQYYESSAHGAIARGGRRQFEAFYRGRARAEVERTTARGLSRLGEGSVSVRHASVVYHAPPSISGDRATIRTRETWLVFWNRSGAWLAAEINEVSVPHVVTMQRISAVRWVVTSVKPAYRLHYCEGSSDTCSPAP